MFRFLFRFAGLVVIAISFLFVVYGTKSIADQTTYISRAGPTWVNIHPNSLSGFEPAVKTVAGVWVWNDVIQPYFLEQPTELVLVIIGALLVLLGSKKSRADRATRDVIRCWTLHPRQTARPTNLGSPYKLGLSKKYRGSYVGRRADAGLKLKTV